MIKHKAFNNKICIIESTFSIQQNCVPTLCPNPCMQCKNICSGKNKTQPAVVSLKFIVLHLSLPWNWEHHLFFLKQFVYFSNNSYLWIKSVK